MAIERPGDTALTAAPYSSSKIAPRLVRSQLRSSYSIRTSGMNVCRMDNNPVSAAPHNLSSYMLPFGGKGHP